MRVIGKYKPPGGHSPKPRVRSRRLRAIAVLPTMATLGNLLCGFAAIQFCVRALFAAGGGVHPMDGITANHQLLERILPSHLAMAGYLIFLAMVFDALDGRLARLTRRTTEFGGQLDSLADMVSFVLAPAMLMLALLSRQLKGEWLVTPLGDTFGRAAWVTAAMFVCFGAVRLARYNVENEPGEHHRNYFKGMPTPGAASVLASLVILHEWMFRHESQAATIVGARWSEILVKAMPVITLVLGLLMVSRVRYLHIGNVVLGGRRPIIHVLLLMVALLLVVLRPEVALAAYLFLYALSGPVLTLARKFRRSVASAAPTVDHRPGDSAPHEPTRETA